MKRGPLTESELNFLEKQFHTYGNDNSLIDVSGLDGFLTAIVSGPDVILPSTWMQSIWGGESPEWEDEKTAMRFFELVFQHMNSLVDVLMNMPDDYEPLMLESVLGDQCYVVVDSWAEGYMRGVTVGAWPRLPDSIRSALEVIALHGTDEGFEQLERMTLEEQQESAESLGSAAIALHQYWLEQRSPPPSMVRREPVRNSSAKVGRNQPCPCGSGKKYKQCCLH